MTSPAVDLRAPVFLMATPQVVDPFFQNSVVLLLGHTEEGSFGFNVNRPTTVSIGEILDGMEIPWGGDPEFPAYFGGPVQPQLGTILFEQGVEMELPKEEMEETSTQVSPGLWMTQHVDDLAFLAKAPPEGFRLYLGYAGWGAGQLVKEILRNDWIVGPVVEELVFAEDPEPVWEKALEIAGVDPGMLSAWTPPEGDQAAN